MTSELGPVTAPDLDYRGRTPYVAYTDSDVLAGLIHPHTDEPLEVTFIVTTQIMELHFQLLIRELERAINRLDDEDQPEAVAALRRAAVTQDSLIGSWRLLSGMSPVQYNRFRAALGSASGFQSFSYRNLEFLLGAKNPSLLRPHADMPAVHARLLAALAAPSLYDAALAYLSRHGFVVPTEVLDRERAQSGEATDARVVQAWRQVYSAGGAESVLAEALTAVAERHTTWRFTHYTTVRRILGDKPGTGGSAGLAWLKQSADAPVFADLWAVRGVL